MAFLHWLVYIMKDIQFSILLVCKGSMQQHIMVIIRHMRQLKVGMRENGCLL